MSHITSVADALWLRTGTPPVEPMDSIMDPASNVEKDMMKEDSRMRQKFEGAMCKELEIPDRYQQAAVLNIRWSKSLDYDLGCEEEVNELDSLFKNAFGYHSEVVVLDNKERPQKQLDSEITRFVNKYDGPYRSHLLIVYYSGHGFIKTGKSDNELVMSGRQNPAEKPAEGSHRPEADFEVANASLRKADADVLLILDCCFACGIMKGGEEHMKSFELLAACGKNTTTPKPGPRSYTRALIDSLKEKLERNENRPFDTYDLNREISKRKSWADPPIVTKLLENFPTRHIVLAPLDKSQMQRKPAPVHNAAELKLRIAFEEKTMLTDEEASMLAECLAEAAKKSTLGISTIDWLGFVPTLPSTERAQTRKLEQIVRATQILKGGITRFRERKRKREDGRSGLGTSTTFAGEHIISADERPYKKVARDDAKSPLTPQTSSRAGTPSQGGPDTGTA